MKTYIYIDVSRKQEYIFKNNELADNLFRSSIIRAITEEDDKEKVKFLNVSLPKYLDKVSNYEIMYTGGGNSVIKFDDYYFAEQFIKEYSKAVLVEYPELELYISISTEEEYTKIKQELDQKSNELKGARKARFRRWTYGVEQINKYGKGQIYKEEDKKEKYKASKKYLYSKLNAKKWKYVKITDQLSQYKKNTANSYIGIISIDGNKMGDMVKKVNSFVKRKKLGEIISEIYIEAVIKSLDQYEENKVKVLLTPIVMAGDDLCIIVEANQSIDIAARIIKNIEDISKLSDYEVDHLTACGGVTIIKAGYPFFEAVKDAERLCHQAKESLSANDKASFLTWNVVKGAILNPDSYEQKVQHDNYIEKFSIKPLMIDDNDESNSSIINYNQMVNIINNIRKYNKEVKNKKDIISNTLLETLKIEMYSGIDNYELYINMNKGEGLKKLLEIVDEQIKQVEDKKYLQKYGVIKREDKRYKEYIYILNDIIEILPYFENGGEIVE